MTAGRSRLLSIYRPLYVLLGDCQGVVGRREGDFDSRYRLSHLFPYVINVHFCILYPDPLTTHSAGVKSIHLPEDDLIVVAHQVQHSADLLELGLRIKPIMFHMHKLMDNLFPGMRPFKRYSKICYLFTSIVGMNSLTRIVSDESSEVEWIAVSVTKAVGFDKKSKLRLRW